jgi:hypothetical protein
VTTNVRACIAYIAGRSISGNQLAGVYDYSQSKKVPLSGSVTPDHIDIYDTGQNCHFLGDRNGSRYTLLYNGNPHPVTLEIKGNGFRGCDHGTSTYFNGKVQSNSVNIYDCESGLSFHFGI